MRTVLCYGDSNTWDCIPLIGSEPTRRFPPHERWPGVLRRELGHGYWVIEEGLNGRTTVWEDAVEPHRNDRELLLPTLLTHQPIDLVIVMLGSNDLKRRIGVSPAEIAQGAGQLVDIVRTSTCGPGESAPEVLLVCPPAADRAPRAVRRGICRRAGEIAPARRPLRGGCRCPGVCVSRRRRARFPRRGR